MKAEHGKLICGLQCLLRSKFALSDTLKRMRFYDEKDDHYLADAKALEAAIYALQGDLILDEAQLAQLKASYFDDWEYFLSGGDEEFMESAELLTMVLTVVGKK